MFKQPHDPLQDYLRSRQPRREEAARRRLRVAWQWANRHKETLQMVWYYGVGLALSIYAFDWPDMWVAPIVALFMMPLIALAELPTLLLITLIWSTITVFYRRIKHK